MKKILPILIAFFAAIPSWGINTEKYHRIDSVKAEMATVTSPEDSIRLMYDIFDLAPRKEKKYVADVLYDLAVRAGDNTTQLDMLRHLTNFNVENDTLRFSYQKKAEMLSPSSDQRMTVLYISIVNSVRAARASQIPVNMERLRNLLERARQEHGASVYTRLEVVLTLCAYLEGKARNGMLAKYLADAEQCISRLSNRQGALDIFFKSQASMDYSAVGEYKKAVETDLRLLEKLDSMEEKYYTEGRKFRNYDYDRYNAYRRLLFNYRILTPEQVDYYYEKVKETAEQDEAALTDLDNFQRPTIYYLLAKKRYTEVIPIILNQLRMNNPHLTLAVRLGLVNELIDAAKAAGDEDAIREGYRMYREIKENNDLYHDQDEYTELQFVYETNVLFLERSQLAVDKQRSELEMRKRMQKSDRVILFAALAVVLILIVVVIFMSRTWKRMKKLNERRAKDNAALLEERDTLRRTQTDLMRASEQARRADRQKEEFINSVSNEIQTPVNAIVEYSQLIVDCIDDARHRYLDRFASVVKLNAELLSTLVGDVLDVASHDKGTFKIEKRPVSVQDICTVAIDTIKDRLPEGVRMINEVKEQPDMLIDTDAKRVAQVLMNLLGNSAKFTTEGSITLSGRLSDDGQIYTFTVTDTGIGIPAGKEEVIFERFKKLSKYSQGVGLGLPVGRIIATLLGGELKVDTTYTGKGSRFIFTVPVK